MSTLHLARVMPVPPDELWRALTEPAALAAWFWPDRFATTAEVDLRVSGRYRVDGPGVGIAVEGEYTSAEPPSRLAFTWRWDGEPDEWLRRHAG